MTPTDPTLAVGAGPPDVEGALAERVVAAVRAAFSRSITTEEALIRPAAARRGADFQVNLALSLAKELGRSPQEVAEAIAAHLEGDVLESVSVEGAGFLNLRVAAGWLTRRVAELAGDPRVGVPEASRRLRVVVDYSGPNVAKEMHVGHLRSTILGDAIVRILRFVGHEVTPQNHLGDWGTPFGMLLEHLTASDPDVDPDRLAIEDLNRFYQEARQRFDADPAFADQARRRVVALQAGDERTVKLWQALVAESQRHFERVYQLLGVLLAPADSRGESSYNASLPTVVDEFGSTGRLVESDGALCVFPAGFLGREDTPVPLIVKKGDGGYTYDTTDLAALRYRLRDLQADMVIYVVGAPQQLHFDLIFAAAREAGWLDGGAVPRFCGFGSVLGEDGKVLRSRTGGGVRLVDLLEEAVDRAAALIAVRGDLVPAQRAGIARAVGIGAVKYADLSNSRERNYVFSFDRMLAMDGNTAVYLQYANARIRSVLRKAEQGERERHGPLALDHDAERALVLKLTQFPAVINATVASLEPHRLTTYLDDTAVLFSAFYERCPVLAAPDADQRRSRLILCQLASDTLTLGLDLLGIESPERL
ncbi:MAG: arginine--tRNA ligase [Acidimicrobiia bacterium]